MFNQSDDMQMTWTVLAWMPITINFLADSLWNVGVIRVLDGTIFSNLFSSMISSGKPLNMQQY